jgi:hypothetical protein
VLLLCAAWYAARPDRTPCDASEFKPYEPTPDWTALDVIDDGKVVELDPYRDRDEPSGAA